MMKQSINGKVVEMTEEEVAEFEASRAIPFEERRQNAINSLMAAIAAKDAAITKNAPRHERDLWPIKGPAAQAYTEGTATTYQSSIIEEEAGLAGKTPQQVAEAITAKAVPYRAASQAMYIIRASAEAAIAAATDGAGVDAALAAAQTSLDAI